MHLQRLWSGLTLPVSPSLLHTAPCHPLFGPHPAVGVSVCPSGWLQVAEQGEMAQRIDENVDDTLGAVDAGQAQLLKYLSAISSNRFLILKVFAVLMAFMVFFIMFIA